MRCFIGRPLPVFGGVAACDYVRYSDGAEHPLTETTPSPPGFADFTPGLTSTLRPGLYYSRPKRAPKQARRLVLGAPWATAIKPRANVLVSPGISNGASSWQPTASPPAPSTWARTASSPPATTWRPVPASGCSTAAATPSTPSSRPASPSTSSSRTSTAPAARFPSSSTPRRRKKSSRSPARASSARPPRSIGSTRKASTSSPATVSSRRPCRPCSARGRSR